MRPKKADMFVLYRPSGLEAALAFRNSAHWAFATSYLPIR
jgi:hypothetical protein